MKTLIEVWPRTLTFDELMVRVRQQLHRDGVHDAAQLRAEERSVAANLIDCFTRRYVELFITDPGCASQMEEQPTIDRLVRLQAEYSGVVYSGLHTVVSLNELQRQIARLADGQHTLPQIVDALTELVQSGKLTVQQAGETITDPTTIRPQLEQAVQQHLVFMAKQGLLVQNS